MNVEFKLKVLIISLIVSLITLYGVLTNISFKSDIINLFFISAFPLFIFMIFGFSKGLIMRFVYAVLIAIPIFLAYTLYFISILLLDSSPSSSRQTLDDGKYTVSSILKSWDNTEENMQIKIYKEVSFFPIMECLIYKSEGINEYLKKAEYNSGKIVLFMERGNYQWIETVNVD